MTKTTGRLLAFCTLVLAFSLLQPAAISQNKQAKPAAGGFGNLWGKPKENPNNGSMVALKEAVQFENLPDFTGHKKFMNGSVREFELGQAWTENFMIKETSTDVLNWYQQVLQMQNWKIVATNEQQLMAKHKDGNTCQIGVQAVRNNQLGKCALTIAYFVPKRTR